MRFVDASRFVDRFVGGVLSVLFSPFKGRKLVERPKKILVVTLWGMGDAVLTLPCITRLQELYPNAKIDVLATKRVCKVYENQKPVSEVLLLENWKGIKKWREYDLVFDLEQYLNSSALASFWLGKYVVGYSHGLRALLYTKKVNFNDEQHMVHTYFDLIRAVHPKVKNPEELLELQVLEEDRKKVSLLLSDLKIEEKDLMIGFCVTTAESAISRRWPPEKFAQLADKLIEKYNAKILLVSGPQDYELNETMRNSVTTKEKVFNLAGKTNLKQTFDLIKRCRVFVSNDTGPMHIGAAQHTPTVGLFGPNTPVRYGPYGMRNISVYKPMLKTPCINVHLGKVPQCEGHHHMSKITVDDVYQAVEKLLVEKK